MTTPNPYVGAADMALRAASIEAHPATNQAMLGIAQVQALLAIAEELRLAREEQVICGHGNRGFCPYCIQLLMNGESI